MKRYNPTYIELMNRLNESYVNHYVHGGGVESILVKSTDYNVKFARMVCVMQGLSFDYFKSFYINEHIDLIGLWDSRMEGLEWSKSEGFYIKL